MGIELVPRPRRSHILLRFHSLPNIVFSINFQPVPTRRKSVGRSGEIGRRNDDLRWDSVGLCWTRWVFLLYFSFIAVMSTKNSRNRWVRRRPCRSASRTRRRSDTLRGRADGSKTTNGVCRARPTRPPRARLRRGGSLRGSRRRCPKGIRPSPRRPRGTTPREER